MDWGNYYAFRRAVFAAVAWVVLAAVAAFGIMCAGGAI